MLLRSFWEEVKGKWPPQYWDDFLRRPDVRQGRHCLRPEVSRTRLAAVFLKSLSRHTFGEKGVSKGQYYKKRLVSRASLACFRRLLG